MILVFHTQKYVHNRKNVVLHSVRSSIYLMLWIFKRSYFYFVKKSPYCICNFRIFTAIPAISNQAQNNIFSVCLARILVLHINIVENLFKYLKKTKRCAKQCILWLSGPDIKFYISLYDISKQSRYPRVLDYGNR